jgi:hypothetical protein
MAIDIITYKVDQTGPKTHAGGLKGASVNCEYHGSLKDEVVKPPIAEAKKVMVNMINNDKYLLFIIKI